MAVKLKIVAGLKYYLRVYLATVKINLIREMQFRLDFLVGGIAAAGWTMITMIFLSAIYGKVNSIVGWHYYELLTLLGFYRLVEGAGEFIFYRSFKKFSEDMRHGRLDSLLTKPVDFQFYISTRYVSIDSISSSLIGAAIFSYGFSHLETALPPLAWLVFTLLALCGFFIHYSFWVLTHALNFWLIKVDNLRNLVHGVVGTTRYPPEAYGRPAEIFFSFLVPLALIVAFPVRVILDRGQWWYLPFSLAMTFALFILSRKFFAFALKSYTSEGG